jgi:hypothetical protein
MSQSLAKNLIHLTFANKNREPLLRDYGTRLRPTPRPSAEALGYSQASLRDETAGGPVTFRRKSNIVEVQEIGRR